MKKFSKAPLQSVRCRCIWSRQPLGLPKGTVRSLITLSTVGIYFIAMFFQMFLMLPVPETMSSMVITVIAFYFGVRSNEDTPARIKR